MKAERRQEAKMQRANAGPRQPGESTRTSQASSRDHNRRATTCLWTRNLRPRTVRVPEVPEPALAFARLPISLPAFEDFENGLDGLVLFMAEFPLDSRNHVPRPKGLIHFVFLVLQL